MSTTVFELDCDVVFEFPLDCASRHVCLQDHAHPVPEQRRRGPEQGHGLPQGHHPDRQRHPGAHLPQLPGGGVPAGARLRPPERPLGSHFERVAQRIHNNRTGSTLVYCAAGMSRSPALVMAYLMRYKGTTLREAHRWVQDSRPYVRPNAGFWRQLLDYEKQLYGKNTVKVAPSLELDPGSQPSALSINRSLGRARYCMYQ
ncbi:hypothetical protein ANANG_G00128980 [Anguilla anguilla]|uniref:Tyrosine specific protein phosphatases domain-containing protein n=1 Tax=Anguilla anguilla TaxID=7936 RepID=A0A9D3MGQ0_ANGAN|nr:hypothetical protein ANANG_G00128980 [Anguilla anguilla]